MPAGGASQKPGFLEWRLAIYWSSNLRVGREAGLLRDASHARGLLPAQTAASIHRAGSGTTRSTLSKRQSRPPPTTWRRIVLRRSTGWPARPLSKTTRDQRSAALPTTSRRAIARPDASTPRRAGWVRECPGTASRHRARVSPAGLTSRGQAPAANARTAAHESTTSARARVRRESMGNVMT